jgi:hypothetical protein
VASWPGSKPAAPGSRVVAERIGIIPRYLVVGAAFVVVATVLPEAGTVLLGLTALHALRGTRQTVEALFVLALAIMFNKALAPIDISLMRWVVLAGAGARTLWDTVIDDEPLPAAFWWLTSLVSTMAVFAYVASWLPTVSLFKSISFYLGAGTAVVALYRTRHLAAYWQSCLLSMAVFVILGSVPLYFLPYGFARNSVGFQGLLTHPQTYGPISAVLTAYVTGLVLYGRRTSWVLVTAMLAGWAGVFYSQSRTGMLALVLAGLIAVGYGWIRREWQHRLPRLVSGPGVVMAVITVCTIAVFYGPNLIQSGTAFLIKDEGTQGVADALEASRGGLTERSMANFREAPLTGIGLGVPSDLSRTTIEYGPFNLPIGASIEKGFTPTAVLEEIGVVGAALLLIFLGALLMPVLGRWGNIPLAWMVFTVLLINMGEAIIFAIGGNGLFFWLIMALGFACTRPDRRPRAIYSN